MSILLIDSFDHYTNVAQKWDIVTGPTISAAAARNGAAGLSISSDGDYVGKNIPNTTTFYIGFALNVRNAPGGNYASLFALVDSSTTQVNLLYNNSGRFWFTRNGTTIGTMSALPFSFLTWHWIQCKVVIDPAAGIIELKVDGNFFIQASGLNTRATGNSYATQFRFGDPGGIVSNSKWLDDLWVFDGEGSQNNTYPSGDRKIICKLPSANGTLNQWTPNGAASNYLCVTETPPNDDTSYVGDATVGDQDRYTFPAISAASVDAVAVNLRAEKDDANTRSLRAVVKSGATVADNGTDFPMPQGYDYFQGIFETDPNTGSAWTVAAVNAAEFGVKVTA